MFTKKLSYLASYLASGNRSISEISKYISLSVFQELQVVAFYVAEVHDDGLVVPIGGFGFRKSILENWGGFPLSLNVPITHAVKTNAVISSGPRKDCFVEYPGLDTLEGLDHEWNSSLAWPMMPFGACALLLNGKPKHSEEFDNFLITVGYLIALHQMREVALFDQRNQHAQRPSKRAQIGLTERQQLVKSLLSKGFTNGQIAREIGYSESLVRHESIAIYATLNVTGRKELIQSARDNV